MVPTRNAGLFFAFFPIPFINSVQSVAMINFSLYMIIFLFLKKKNITSNGVDYFFLLYPSLLLYSSVALREVLILLFVFMSFYTLIIREKTFQGLIIGLPLVVLKLQNYLIILLATVVYKFFSKTRLDRKISVLVVSGLIFLVFKDLQIARFTFGEYFTLEKLEFYRYSLFAEEYGYDWGYVATLDYQPIKDWFSLLLLSVKSFVYMLFKPFPWESHNILQLVQSIENLIIFGLIVFLNSKKLYGQPVREKVFFLNIFLVISMTIYGLVVFNVGSAARYRFSFLSIYFVFFLYFLCVDRLFFTRDRVKMS
tara:strand:- start:637 stop:1566 length:930 start_codon:yes stop_codon:yes gene_type:complete